MWYANFGCSIFHDRKTGPWLSFHYAPRTYLGPVFTHSVYCIQSKQAAMQAKYRVVSAACSLQKVQYGGTLQLAIYEFPSKVHPIHLNIRSSADHIENEKFSTNSNEEHQVHNIDVDPTDKIDIASNSGQSTTDICESEMQRRRKIGLANKGRIPWNKGRKHSEGVVSNTFLVSIMNSVYIFLIYFLCFFFLFNQFRDSRTHQ